MKTSCFFTYFGPGRISIALYAPKTIPPGYKVYKPLAPFPYMLKIKDKNSYLDLYQNILSNLDPNKVFNDLIELVAPYEPVLLCWEKLIKPEEFCHRRIVADWFESTLGITVEEILEVGVTPLLISKLD